MTNNLSDEIDEFFTSLKDLIDSSRNLVCNALENFSQNKPPTKSEWLNMCEDIYDEMFD